jgi:HEAT repeat protein/cyclophilin family peptidyl-prolyl cis-trans isomerase
LVLALGTGGAFAPRLLAQVNPRLTTTAVQGRAQLPARPRLAPADIDDIATLVMLEDRRQLDSTALVRMLASSHPEVRRRAAIAVGRIAAPAGRGARPNPAATRWLLPSIVDRDTAVAATAVFAIGQLHDSATIALFDSLLSNPATPPTVAAEAALALGKTPTPEGRAALAQYLSGARAGARDAATVGGALLSIGRATTRGEIAPIVKWTTSPNAEVRWRATWALFRARDPRGVATLITLAKDPSPIVRSWAVRGLTKAQAETASVAAEAEARLLVAARDVDRRVRTEAIRALASYSDSAAVRAMITALASPDSWVAVSAAEGLGRQRAGAVELVRATGRTRPCAVRYTAVLSLQMFDPARALEGTMAVARDTTPYCRTMAYTALARPITRATLGNPSAEAMSDARIDSLRGRVTALLDTLRAERRRDLASRDASRQVPALRAIAAWADSSDIAPLQALRDRTARDSSQVSALAAAALAAIDRRQSGQTGRAGGAGRGGAATQRTIEDYRRIVTQWVVPDYEGRPRPMAQWRTPGGTFDIELFPADAPLAVDDFVRTMHSGTMLGTEFTRVVPDFVNQQQTIRGGNSLRDEVSRRGLPYANLSWASAGLDTGSPGYTLGHTPQPHNEGNFTALGRVVRGMDVVERIGLGDRIVAAKMIR